MDLTEGHRLVTIGSGGCNMLAYLSRLPASIDVVDLNPNHVALNRLKLAAFRHLPDHAFVEDHVPVAPDDVIVQEFQGAAQALGSLSHSLR